MFTASHAPLYHNYIRLHCRMPKHTNTRSQITKTLNINESEDAENRQLQNKTTAILFDTVYIFILCLQHREKSKRSLWFATKPCKRGADQRLLWCGLRSDALADAESQRQSFEERYYSEEGLKNSLMPTMAHPYLSCIATK